MQICCTDTTEGCEIISLKFSNMPNPIHAIPTILAKHDLPFRAVHFGWEIDLQKIFPVE